MEVSATLPQVNNLITKISRQIPASHRGDSHKIDFLRKATVEHTCSHEPLSRISKQNPSFKMLYGELEASLQLGKEFELALAHDNDLHRKSHRTDDCLGAHTLRRPGSLPYKYNSKFMRPRSKTKLRTGPIHLDIASYFNCGDPKHKLKDSKKPLNASKAAAWKFEYFKQEE